jgi:hypothetical protein
LYLCAAQLLVRVHCGDVLDDEFPPAVPPAARVQAPLLLLDDELQPLLAQSERLVLSRDSRGDSVEIWVVSGEGRG